MTFHRPFSYVQRSFFLKKGKRERDKYEKKKKQGIKIDEDSRPPIGADETRWLAGRRDLGAKDETMRYESAIYEDGIVSMASGHWLVLPLSPRVTKFYRGN